MTITKSTNILLLGLCLSVSLGGTLVSPRSIRRSGSFHRFHHSPASRSPSFHLQLISIRGGSQTPPSSSDPFARQYEHPPQLHSDDKDDPFHETVQERVDTWREHQRAQAAIAQESPRDEQGRFKLLTSVSRGSRAFIFFMLMWRNIHLYEVADQTHKGLVRVFFVVPLVVLFVANMAGVVASLSSPSHSAKKRLKAILNLDKLLELGLIAFYFVRLTFLPSAYTPRELYIVNTFHSLFFILQCQAFTRFSWDDKAVPTVDSYRAHQQQHHHPSSTDHENDIMSHGDFPDRPQWSTPSADEWQSVPPSTPSQY